MFKQIRLSPSLQILCAIVLGALCGWIAPQWSQQLRPVGELFIAAVRLLVGPVIFFSVASGIATMRDLRQLRLAGVSAVIYFEVVALLALVCGLVGSWLIAPGAGTVLAPVQHAGPAVLINASMSTAVFQALLQNSAVHLLLSGVVCGIGLACAGPRAQPLARLIETGTLFFGKLIKLILLMAPVATFCAIAVTVSGMGLAALAPMLKLLLALYVNSVAFVLIVLGAIAACSGFSLWRFILYVREELMLVVGTSSSIAAMPSLTAKLERLGCSPPLVRAVVSVGFCINLNGSNVYLMTALLFLAQASHIDISAWQYLLIIAAVMVTSKGACGVTGSAFVALGATIVILPGISDSTLLLVFAIERLLKCRSLTNFVGNGVACLALCAWVKQVDRNKLQAELDGQAAEPVAAPATFGTSPSISARDQ